MNSAERPARWSPPGTASAAEQAPGGVRVQITGVTVTRGGTPILEDVDLDLTESRIGVIGLNGSGKSTLVRLINGLVAADHGSVQVNGLDVAVDPAKVRRHVGFVFSDPDAQIIMPTPAEDVAFSLRRSGLGQAELRERVDRALSDFGLDARRDAPSHLLSGGEKQLLALAAVLVTEPGLVILDEPTTLLDLRNSARITQVVTALQPMVILVTHQLENLVGFDRVVVIHRGKVFLDAEPERAIAAYRELAAEPDSPGWVS